jgi:leucyl-tRNA synthetase
MQTDILKNLLAQKVESFSTEQKKQYKVIELYKIINKLSKSLKNSDQQQTALRLLKKTIDAISPQNPEPSDEFLSSYQALRQHFFMEYKYDPEAKATIYLLVGLLFGVVLGWIIKSFWLGLPIGFFVAFFFYYTSLNNVKKN